MRINKKTFKRNSNEYLLQKWIDQIVKDSEVFMDNHLEFVYPYGNETAKLELRPDPLVRKRSLLFKDISFFRIHLYFNDKLLLTYIKDASQSKYNDFSLDEIERYQVKGEKEWVDLKSTFKEESYVDRRTAELEDKAKEKGNWFWGNVKPHHGTSW